MHSVKSARERRLSRKRIFFNRVFTIIQCCGVLISMTSNYYVHFSRHSWTFDRIIGLVVFCISYTGWVQARLDLGESFTYSASSKVLVTHGVYSVFSHPIYIFSGAGMFGYILLIGKPILFIPFSVLMIIQVIRSNNESKVLEEAFGDVYREYKERVWI